MIWKILRRGEDGTGILYERVKMGQAISNESKGTIAIIAAALFWGFEFVVEKDVLYHIDPNWSNAIRFFISSLIIIGIWNKKFKSATKEDWKQGLFCGGIMGLGYAFQTMGLETINAGVNAFLCVAYIVIIPFLVWFIKKIRPNKLVFISAIIAIAGVSIMSLEGLTLGEFSIGKGEVLTLVGSIFYAGGIVSVEYYAKSMDSLLFAGIQCVATFGVSIIFALIIESPPTYFDSILFWEFVYLIVFASILTQIMFTYGMKYVSSHRASILFLLESISAIIFGRVMLNEKIRINQIIGAILIIIAIILTNRTEEES